MQTWVCAILFIIVGYLLAVLIGMIMGHGKVKVNEKLNRDNIIGIIDGYVVIHFIQKKCNWYGKNTEIAKKIYNQLINKYSEKQVVEYMNQLFGKEKKGLRPENIQMFLQDLQNFMNNNSKEDCPTNSTQSQVSQAPHNYNLGPFQYMARNGCGM
jgi:hypothetical protein